MSTEADVRSAIVTQLETDYADFGFDNSPGNIKAYLPEGHEVEDLPAYFKATVSSKKISRVIAVRVTFEEVLFTTNNQAERTYNILIQVYSKAANDGSGEQFVIEGARKVLNSLRSINTDLSNTVDFTDDFFISEPTKVFFPELEEMMLVELTSTAKAAGSLVTY